MFLAPGNLSIIVPPPPSQLLMKHSSRKAGVSPVRQGLLGEPHPVLGQDCSGKSPVHRVPWGRAWVALKKGPFTNSTCRQQKSTTGCQSYKPKAQGGVLSVFCLGRRGKGRDRGEGSQFYQGKVPSSGRYNNNKALTKLKI